MNYLELAPFKPSGNRIEDQAGPVLLAVTVWGEARGEGLEGMQAVANVVINRCKKPIEHWWYDRNLVDTSIESRIKAVVLKQWQFSIFNHSDPNRLKLMVPWKHDSRKIWESAQLVAAGALDNLLEDITNGSDHYHSYPRSRLDLWPKWAKEGSEAKTNHARVGAFHFYQLEP